MVIYFSNLFWHLRYDTKRFKRIKKFRNSLPSVNLSLRCFFKLNLVFIADSLTGFCSRLLIWKHKLNLLNLWNLLNKLKTVKQVKPFTRTARFDNLHFWFKLVCFHFCIIVYRFHFRYNWFCYNQKQLSGGVLQKRYS